MSARKDAALGVRCPQCDAVDANPLHLAVRWGAESDLDERVRAGTLHDEVCEACHAQVRFDAPLLVLDERHAISIVFSPATSTTPQEDRVHLVALIQHLEAQGNAVHARWDALFHGVARPSLPSFVTQVRAPRGPDTDTTLVALLELNEQSSWPDIRAAIESVPALLRPETDALHAALIAAVNSGGDVGRVADLETDRALLGQCRDEGVEGAFQYRVPVAPPPLADLWDEVGTQISRRNDGDPDALSKALDVAQSMVGSPEFGEAPPGFCMFAHEKLARIARTMADAPGVEREQALRCLVLAVESHRLELHLRPPSHIAERIRSLNNMANVCRVLFARTDRVEALDQAVSAWEEAATADPSVLDPMGVGIRTNLAAALRERFLRGGQREDIEQSVQVLGETMDRIPEDHPDFPSLLNTYGNSRFASWNAGLDSEGLDASIRAWMEGLRLNGSKNPELAGNIAGNQANALRQRFVRSGNLDDLRQAVDLQAIAVQLTPESSDDYLYRLTGLGNALMHRFQVGGDVADLYAGVNTLEKAVEHTREDSRLRADVLANLAHALKARYHHDGKQRDLRAVVDIQRRAIEWTAPESASYAPHLASLGRTLLTVYERYGDEASLQEAATLLRDSVERTAVDTSARVERLRGLGRAEAALASHEDNAAGAESDDAFREAATRFDLDPEGAAEAAMVWGDGAAAAGRWDIAAEAFALAMDAADALYAAQTSVESQRVILRDLQGLPSRAAYAWVQLGRTEDAVTALERGRARGLSDALGLAPARLASLAENRFAPLDAVGLQTMLASLGNVAGALIYVLTTPWGGLVLGVTASEVEAVLIDVSDKMVHGWLRRYRDWESLSRDEQVEYGSQRIRSYAFDKVGAPSDEVGAFSYDSWKGDEFGGLVRRGPLEGGYLAGLLGVIPMTTALDEALEPLGGIVSAAVLQLIGRLGVLDSGASVTLVPSGLLALLPIHAAPLGGPNGSQCLLDHVATSTIPSGSVLRLAVDSAREDGQAPVGLLVANPAGSNPPLEMAGLESLRARTALESEPGASVSVLHGDDATEAAVRRQVRDATHVHLACHGHFDPFAPLESRLTLAEGETITLQEMQDERWFERARLVVLSACSTAMSDVSFLPDEALGMAPGMMQAGAPAVIGSLWPVADVPSALLMAKLYEGLFPSVGASRLTPAQALATAQRWIRDVSAEELADYFRGLWRSDADQAGISGARAQALWRAFGALDPDAKPFGHPIDWAGWVLTGA